MMTATVQDCGHWLLIIHPLTWVSDLLTY